MFKGKLNDEGSGLEDRTKAKGESKSESKSEIPHFVRDDKMRKEDMRKGDRFIYFL